MKAHTEYLVFNTRKRHELVNITDRVAEIVQRAKIREGLCLVSAMHITAGIWVNDEEDGLKTDLAERLPSAPPPCRARCTPPPASGCTMKRTASRRISPSGSKSSRPRAPSTAIIRPVKTT